MYQILVFVADVDDEAVLFQSETQMIRIKFPERLRKGLENAKFELALINGVKVKDGAIELSAHTTMIRVLDREQQNQTGFQISRTKSFPVGDYLSWPRDYDKEGKKTLEKVFPFVGRFFERCANLYMKPTEEFKCNNEMDNFLHTHYISKRWTKWSETTNKLLQQSSSKQDENEESSTITFEVSDECDQSIKREYDSDEEDIPRKKFKKSNSGSSRKVNELVSSDDSSSSNNSPSDDFITNKPISQIGIRPIISFSENQKDEFQKSLAHYQKCCFGTWRPFIFKYLTRPDFVQIVRQTLTIVGPGKIKALETFLETGQTANRKDMKALFTRVQNTPTNFEF